jgi:hypothetical protein
MRLLQGILPFLFVGSLLTAQTALAQAPAPDSAQPAAPERPIYTVPSGTKVLLQLNSAINTKAPRPETAYTSPPYFQWSSAAAS